MLLDLGSGALGTLQQHVDASTIDAVFLSHLHADHCLDLCGYYVMRKFHPTGAMPRIPVWGPADTAARMAKAYDLDEDPGMNEEFDFQPYGATAVRLGPFTVTARRVVHPVTAYALRIEADGRVLAYSGDTGVCHGLDDAAREADLFLCEASFLEGAPNPPDLHLTGREAGTTAAGAGSKRLVLTHVPPWHDREQVLAEAAEVYDGPLELARVGATYDV